MLQNTLKQLKRKDRTKLLKQLSADLPTGCNVSTRNPAITSELLQRITYIRTNADKLNPTELNEALQMLGFPVIDSWNPTIIDEQRRLICSYLNERTATGNPITLNIIGNLTPEVTGLKVTMNPIQDLHGYSNPWAGGAGKNKFDIGAPRTATVNDVTFTVNADGTVTVNGTANGPAEFVLYQSVSESCPFIGDILNGCPIGGSQSTFDLRISDVTTSSSQDFGNGITINVSETGRWRFVIMIRSGYTADNLLFKPMIRSSTVTDATFAPYSNICPITGRDEVSVTRTAGEDEETKTHQYSETIYGGVDDFVNGELTNEWGYIASYDGETLPGEWISDRDVYTPDTTPTTGAEVAYKLATPTTIETSAEEITLLKGENVLSTDGDSIDLKYKLSLI